MSFRLLPSSSIAAAVALLLIASPAWSDPPKESWTGSTPDQTEEDVDDDTESREATEVVEDLETTAPEDTTASAGQRRLDPSRSADDRCLVRAVVAVLHADRISRDVELAVDSKDGVVFLEGELPTQEAVDRVSQLVADVQGVNSVDASALTVVVR
jgi:osmotically-inducible protein OsmY